MIIKCISELVFYNGKYITDFEGWKQSVHRNKICSGKVLAFGFEFDNNMVVV